MEHLIRVVVAILSLFALFVVVLFARNVCEVFHLFGRDEVQI